MREEIVLTLFITLGLILIFSISMRGETSIQLPELTLNLSTDKEVYHSSEEMSLTVAVGSENVLENVTIRVYGVKDRGGRYRIHAERTVDLEPPETIETFTFQMPSCYGCAGVSSGDYDIVMEVLKDRKLIGNVSKIIKLEK